MAKQEMCVITEKENEGKKIISRSISFLHLLTAHVEDFHCSMLVGRHVSSVWQRPPSHSQYTAVHRVSRDGIHVLTHPITIACLGPDFRIGRSPIANHVGHDLTVRILHPPLPMYEVRPTGTSLCLLCWSVPWEMALVKHDRLKGVQLTSLQHTDVTGV